VVTDTLDTFVAVNVIDLFTRWVIVLVYNRFYRTLVDASAAVNTGIINDYCHRVLLG
jgi:hypothetical protein